jgi:hypothetical protein
MKSEERKMDRPRLRLANSAFFTHNSSLNLRGVSTEALKREKFKILWVMAIPDLADR